MRQINSATTTSPMEPSSRIGTPLGGHGLATQENSQAVAAWLAKQAPVDMDKAAVLRASQHGVGLRVKCEWRYPTGQNGEYLPSYAVAVGCEISEAGDHAAALVDLKNFMTPAPVREIEGWLAVLSVTVAKRRDDEFAEELRLTTYAGRLARYPADIARAVTGATYTFWPTWAEMEKRCEAMAGPRRQMIAALERGPEKPERNREATAEERAAMQALVDELFPQQTEADRKRAVDIAMAGNCIKETEA